MAGTMNAAEGKVKAAFETQPLEATKKHLQRAEETGR
jgi:hypothetical protein